MTTSDSVSGSAPRAMTSNDRNGMRVYTHPVTGEEFFSVTSILKAISKPKLEKWKIRMVSEFAADQREMLAGKERDAALELIRSSQFTSSGVAAATGEAVHSRLELLFRQLQDADGDRVSEWQDENPAPPELAHVDQCFRELLDEFEIKPLFMENTLVNRSVGYAGSADLIAEIRPRTDRGGLRMNDTAHRPPFKRAVIDAKSGKSIHGDVALQLVGYAKAEAILMPDGTEIDMPPIHQTFALHVRPRSWKLVPARYDVEVWNVFRAAARMSQWLSTEERKAIGPALNQGAISRMRGYDSTLRQSVRDAA